MVLSGEGEMGGGEDARGASGEANTRVEIMPEGRAASTSEARDKDNRDRRRLTPRRGAGAGAGAGVGGPWSGHFRSPDGAGGDLDEGARRRLASVVETRRALEGEIGRGGEHGGGGGEGEIAQASGGDGGVRHTTAAGNGDVVIDHGSASVDGHVAKRQQKPPDRNKAASSSMRHGLVASRSGDAAGRDSGDGRVGRLPPERRDDDTTTTTAAAAANDDTRVLAARGGDEIESPPAKEAQADTTVAAAEASAAAAAGGGAEFFPIPSTKDAAQRSSSSSRSCACARYIGEFGAAPVERGYWFKDEPVENARARIDALCGHIFRRRQQTRPEEEETEEEETLKEAGKTSRGYVVCKWLVRLTCVIFFFLFFLVI